MLLATWADQTVTLPLWAFLSLAGLLLLPTREVGDLLSDLVERRSR